MLGGDPNGVLWKDFAFIEWRDKHGHDAPWTGKEFIALADALKAIGDEATARSAWKSYLASTDPYYDGNPPRLFLASLSKWVARAKPKALRRDKMREDGPWADRTKALLQIHREVNADVTIPEAEKRSEASRRFKEMFPE